MPDAVARLIDHTLLRPEASDADVRRLCDEALEHGFAAVCVNPVWVPLASGRVVGSAVRVCTVAGFPLGASAAAVKALEARHAIEDGAHEIDMVIDIGAIRSDDPDRATRDIAGVVDACHDRGALCKVIVEAALLSREQTTVACRLAAAAGADFVKTSTGFGPGGATVEDVALMRDAVGPGIGVKAAGGIRSLAMLEAMVGAGATRIGTSAGVAIVAEAAATGGQPRT